MSSKFSTIPAIEFVVNTSVSIRRAEVVIVKKISSTKKWPERLKTPDKVRPDGSTLQIKVAGKYDCIRDDGTIEEVRSLQCDTIVY